MTNKNLLKSCCLVVLILLCQSVFAQTKLVILYREGKIKNNITDYLKPNTPIKWSGNYSIDEFTINDSITYYEKVETYDEKDEFVLKTFKRGRKTKVLGKSFVPGSVYCNYANGTTTEEVEWKDDNYLVKDKIESKQQTWMLIDETKVVNGYNCKKAGIFNAETNEMEVIVWYTDAFKCSYSKTGDTALAGIILETYVSKTNTLTTAIDVQIEPNPIMLPSKGVIIVTKEEFEKLKKNKKKD